jgi:hypothetical protein
MNVVQISNRIKIVQALLILQAIIWFVFGVWTWIRQSMPLVATLILSALMLANAIIFLGIAWGIGKQIKLVFYFGLLFLFANLVLSVTDEFGIFDL